MTYRPTPEQAIRAAVDSLGGLQSVGHRLRPELDPILAGQWLAHCLDAERREKLAFEQIVWIFSTAKLAGKHAGFEQLAEACGYRVTAVIDPKDELADLVRRSESALRQAAELSEEALARAAAMHLKVNI
jgi:hypothetical protein